MVRHGRHVTLRMAEVTTPPMAVRAYPAPRPQPAAETGIGRPPNGSEMKNVIRSPPAPAVREDHGAWPALCFVPEARPAVRNRGRQPRLATVVRRPGNGHARDQDVASLGNLGLGYLSMQV